MKKEKDQPVHEIRIGRVRATIWENGSDEQKTPWYTVTASRSYKDNDGDWHDVKSFNYSDLPCVGKILEDAMTWIRKQSAIDSRESFPGHAMKEGSALGGTNVGRKKRRSK